VGFKVTEKWGIPSDLAIIIHRHPISRLTDEERTKAYISEPVKQALACVEMATRMCEVLGIGHRAKNDKLDLTTLESAKILGFDKAKIDALLPALNEAFQKERAIFN